MLGYKQFSGKMQRTFHLKKISQWISNIRSRRCKNFSIKQASGLMGGGVPILWTLPLVPASTAHCGCSLGDNVDLSRCKLD